MLVSGAEAEAGMQAYMDEHEFKGCIHCEGFDDGQ